MDNQFICPHCGGVCVVQKSGGEMKKRGILSRLFGRGGGEFEMSRSWQAEIIQPTLHTAEKPQDPSLLLRFVKLPLWQSLISGLFAALAISGLIMGLARYFKWKLTVWDLALIYTGCATAVCVLIWFVLFVVDRLTLLLNEVVEVLERVFRVDINKDGLIGTERKRPSFDVTWTDPGNKAMRFDEWPVSEDQIRELAEACLGGVALSKRELAKHTSLSGDKALEVLGYMRRKAYAHYTDGNTTELTGRGEHFFSKLLLS